MKAVILSDGTEIDIVKVIRKPSMVPPSAGRPLVWTGPPFFEPPSIEFETSRKIPNTRNIPLGSTIPMDRVVYLRIIALKDEDGSLIPIQRVEDLGSRRYKAYLK